MSLLRRDDDPQPITGVKPASYGHIRAVTAAAQRINTSDKGELERLKARRAQDKWQDDAWEFYDLIGEIKYAFNLVGSVMSRMRLYPGYITGTDVAPSNARSIAELPPGVAASADDIIRRLDTAHGGQPGLIKDAAINLSVAGECYLVQEPAKPGSGLPEIWSIKSVDELVSLPSPRTNDPEAPMFGIKSRRSTAQNAVEPLPRRAYVGRIWRMHPRYSDESDSSMRGLLELCDELLLLSRAVRATARSRLNAGALFVPDELSVSRDQPEDANADLPDGVQEALPLEEEDSFEEELMNSMTTPIADEESASAVVPLIIRGPAELGDKIKLIKFERSFDAQLTQRYDRVLERILQGIDVPKDVVTGLANIKYSNAIQIEESLYKAHIEPLALLICDALTVVFLRPAMLSLGYPDEIVSKLVVWYDPSEIVTAPDKAGAANTGHMNFALSNDAWRRSNGFTDEDAPTAEEIISRLASQRGQLSDAVTEAALSLIAPDLMKKVREMSQADSPAPLPSNVEDLLAGRQPSAGPAATPSQAEPPRPDRVDQPPNASEPGVAP